VNSQEGFSIGGPNEGRLVICNLIRVGVKVIEETVIKAREFQIG